MKRNKGMQLSAVLAVMLLLSMAFVPAVSAQAEKAGKNQFDASNFQNLSLSDIQNLSDKEIESLMTEDQKKLFQDLAKQDYSIIEDGDDKSITVPTIDENGKVIENEVSMTLLSQTTDTKLYLVESGKDKELLTVEKIDDSVRVTGYAYDKTKAISEYDTVILKDEGRALYEIWVEDGYLRIWLPSNVVDGSVIISLPILISAIVLALFLAGVVITTAVTLGAAIIAGVIIGIPFMVYMNPDGSFDYWVEMSDINTYIDKCTNWWHYDFGIIDSYTGLNRNHYIPIPYGPV